MLACSLFAGGGNDADCEDSEEEPVKKKSDGPGMKAEGFSAVKMSLWPVTETELQWSTLTDAVRAF